MIAKRRVMLLPPESLVILDAVAVVR